MMLQAGQHVVAVLPNRFSDDHACVRMYRAENVHSHALTGDETVLLDGIERMAAHHPNPLAPEHLYQPRFHLGLRWPA